MKTLWYLFFLLLQIMTYNAVTWILVCLYMYMNFKSRFCHEENLWPL